MSPLRPRLRQLTWIALVAMLGLALLPAMSRALAGDGGPADWAEVCSQRGAQPGAANGALPDEAPALPGLQHLDHCPLCSLGAQLGMPPVVAAVAAVAVPAEVPESFLQARRTPQAWRRALPRGPPSLG